MLDPDLLRSFVAISETGSFTAAARAVGRTQSALSMQMQRLEAVVGKPLLRRSSHGVELTSFGHVLLGHADRILRAHRDALADFGRDKLEGIAVVGMPDDYAPRLLPHVAEIFSQFGSEARLEIVSDETEVLLRLLAEGAVDLAFVTDAVAGGGRGPIVYRERAVWVAAEAMDVHRLDPLPLVLFRRPDLYRWWIFDALKTADRRHRVVATSQSMAGLQAIVKSGLGVSAVTESSLVDGLRVLTPEEGFPDLPSPEVRLERGRGRTSALIAAFEAQLVERLPRIG